MLFIKIPVQGHFHHESEVWVSDFVLIYGNML